MLARDPPRLMRRSYLLARGCRYVSIWRAGPEDPKNAFEAPPILRPRPASDTA